MEIENIKSELILILENKNFDNNKSKYLLFIEKYVNLNKEYNDKLKLLYLNMLDKTKLISSVKNNINEELKHYNFNMILKSSNSQSKNEIIIDKNFNNIINDNIDAKNKDIINIDNNDNDKDNENDKIDFII